MYLVAGRNDRIEIINEEDIEDAEDIEEIENNINDDYDDIIENPGDYDEDGERGYWAD